MTCISHKHRFAFVHIYKAGGTSITNLLLPHARLRERSAQHHIGRKLFYAVNIAQSHASGGKAPAGTSSWYMGLTKHAHLSDVVRYIGPKYLEYKLFSIIRNPVSWVESQYNYISMRPLHARYTELTNMSFADFVTDFIVGKHGLQTDMLKCVKAPDGSIARLDALFTLDNVAKDPRTMISYLDLPAISTPMQQHNRSSKRAFYADLPSTLKARLTDYLAADITAYTAARNAGGALIATPNEPLPLPEPVDL